LSSIRARAVLVAVICCSAWTVLAAQVDILPGDYVALPPGNFAVTGYLFQRDVVGPYVGGTQVGTARIRADVAAVRVNGYREIAGMTWAWSVTPLWSTAHLAAGTLPAAFGRDAGGSGDMRLAATLWPVADAQRGEYLGLSVAWFQPSGNYSNRRILNIGENRSKLVLLAGWSTALTQSLRLELIPELAFFGDNSDYLVGRLRKQDETLAVTGYLRWRAAPQWDVFAGAQANGGGETSINGVRQNDVARNNRLLLGVSRFFGKAAVASLRYGRDVNIENGLRLDSEWMFRISRRF